MVEYLLLWTASFGKYLSSNKDLLEVEDLDRYVWHAIARPESVPWR